MTDKKHKRMETPAEPKMDENEIIEGEIIEDGEEALRSDQPAGDVSVDAEEAVIDEEYTRLVEELQQAQTKAKEYFEGWQRERADFANYKRRIERDSQMLSQNLKGDVIKKYLSILDDLERAMKNRPTEGAAESWSNGIELIMRKLQSMLEAEGVRRIPAETEEFNPTRHEAITHEDSPDHKSGEIIEVVQQGYTLGDRVLRPALVRVARG